MPSVKQALRRVDAQSAFIAVTYSPLFEVVEIARDGLRVMKAHEPQTVVELQASFIEAMRSRLAADVTPGEMALIEELLTDFGLPHRAKLARLSRLIEIEKGKTLCAQMGNALLDLVAEEREEFISAEVRRAFDQSFI